jgi:hypothetical protein
MRQHIYTRFLTGCAIWCRVSKTEQETANQLEKLRQWAQRKGLEVTREYVFEVGTSYGSAKHRDMLTRALADARLGRFEAVLVWALDRVSREGVEATLAILRRFAGHGAAVWSLKEPWTDRDGRPEDGRAARRCTPGWRPGSPAVVSSGPGPGWSAVSRRACRSAGSQAQRIRSRGAAVDTWRGGSQNGPWQAKAGPVLVVLARRFCNRVVKKPGIALTGPPGPDIDQIARLQPVGHLLNEDAFRCAY